MDISSAYPKRKPAKLSKAKQPSPTDSSLLAAPASSDPALENIVEAFGALQRAHRRRYGRLADIVELAQRHRAERESSDQ